MRRRLLRFYNLLGVKRYLEKLVVFKFGLALMAIFARGGHYRITKILTNLSAKLNLLMNKPDAAADTAQLAKRWQQLMPADGQQFFTIQSITPNTAFTEIHLRCPLRGSGNTQACYHLMNYDRKLIEQVGGELIVLESQANSGKQFCRLAIRKKGADVSDLTPAHIQNNRKTGTDILNTIEQR